MSSIFLFIVQLSLCHQLSAQADSAAYPAMQFISKKPDSMHGLPVNAAFKIIRDSAGYLWLITGEGPVPFDGKNLSYHKGMSSNIASFNFLSEPFPFQPVWFMGVILVTFFSIGYLSYARRRLRMTLHVKNLELIQQKQSLEIALNDIASKNLLIEKVAWAESHQLRGSLSKIIGLVDLVKRYNQFNGIKKSKKQLLEDIGTTADEMDQILRSLNSHMEESQKKMAKELFQVVIIDDDKAVLFLNELMIRKSLVTKHISKFSRAKEALEYLNSEEAQHLPYIVFLDINMPEMNGWEFLEHLEKSDQKDQIHVVMVTSSIRSVDKDRAKLFGRVVQYVEKPLKQDHINELKKAARLGPLLAGVEN